MQDVALAVGLGDSRFCSVRRRIVGSRLHDHRHFAELAAAFKPIEGVPGVGHREASVDHRLHKSAVEHIEQLTHLSDAYADARQCQDVMRRTARYFALERNSQMGRL